VIYNSSGFLRRLAAAWCVATPLLAADFDGDGNDDLLFRDRSRGDQRITVMLAGQGSARLTESTSLLLSTDTSGGSAFAVHSGDFDGDGRSDILDRDLQSGRIRVRLMDGIRVRSKGTLTGVPLSTAVTLDAVADLNGDGHDDLVFRDTVTGAWKLRLMNGLASATLGTDTALCGRDPALALVVAADFDGDRRADLLLRHAGTLAWSLCRLDGLRVRDSTAVGLLPRDPQWLLQASADMNRDGTPDLLFRNRDTGYWYTWFLRGSSVLALSGPTGITTNTAYRLQALADFNGDRYPDALLMRPDTGELYLNLLMERWRLAGSATVALPADPGARIAATADFMTGGGLEALLRGEDGDWSLASLTSPTRPVLEFWSIPAPATLSYACEPPRALPLGTAPLPAGVGTFAAFLNWNRPVTRANGDPLCAYEIGGFLLSLQSSAMSRPKLLQIDDPQAESWLLEDLSPGSWSFSIRAKDLGGLLSPPSARSLKLVR
jgi:hypothetical protein